jgi:membrane-associated phospholipid phosphatase
MMRVFSCFSLFFILVSTDIQSQHVDSLSSGRESHPKNKWISSVTISAVLISGGVVLAQRNNVLDRYDVRSFRNQHFPTFHTKIDNFLVSVPAAAVYGLNFINIRGKNRFPDRTALLIKSELLASVMVFSLKEVTGVLRPDGSTRNSFPSGHTTYAFAAATFLSKEFREKSIWYAVGGYTIAAGVGAMRVLNNRHWISDVVAGAGFGILSTNIAYLTHQYKWSKGRQLTFVPSYSGGSGGIYFSYKF